MPRALFMFLKLLLSGVCRVAGCTVLTGEASDIGKSSCHGGGGGGGGECEISTNMNIRIQSFPKEH